MYRPASYSSQQNIFLENRDAIILILMQDEYIKMDWLLRCSHFTTLHFLYQKSHKLGVSI